MGMLPSGEVNYTALNGRTLLERLIVELTEIVQHVINLSDNQTARAQLVPFLSQRSAAEIYFLIAIMYIGRGEAQANEVFATYIDVSNLFSAPSLAIDQMLGKAPLSKYLSDGVGKLNQQGIDLNTLLSSYSEPPIADEKTITLSLGPPWYCDTCGEIINSVDAGVVQWLVRPENERRFGKELKIVHHLLSSPRKENNGCYLNEPSFELADYHLTEMLETDGLVRLLSLAGDDVLPFQDVNRMIMRLFVPGYEQARRFFTRALSDGVVKPSLPTDYFFQEGLRTIIANSQRWQ